MDWIWTIVCALATILSVVYGFVKYQYSHWKRRGVPYLEPKFPFGNLSEYSRTKHPVDVIDEFYRSYKDQTPFMGAYFTLVPVAIITDLDLIHKILIKDFNMFLNRGFYYNARDDPISAHMFSLDGEEWREVRRKFTPSFTPAKMKFMFPTVTKVAEKFMPSFDQLMVKNNVVEIRGLLARFTTDVIGTVAFGIECNSLEDPNTKFRMVGKRVFDEPRHSKFVQVVLSLCPNLGRFFRVKLFADSISEFFMNVVQEIVQQRETTNFRRQDFMDLLIEMKNSPVDKRKIDMNQLTAQAFVFFLAGFETSSTTISFVLYNLATHPEIQERARQEVLNVLQKHDNEFTYEAIMEMTYMDQIINETLRLFPPLAGLTRRVMADYKVPGTDHVFEKDASLLIPVYSIHHDPKNYPEPDKFDPERFTPEAIRQRHPMAFLPFGDGPRNCIGLRFGVMVTIITVSLFLQNYRIRCCSKTAIPLRYSMKNIILSPEDGMWLQFDKI